MKDLRNLEVVVGPEGSPAELLEVGVQDAPARLGETHVTTLKSDSWLSEKFESNLKLIRSFASFSILNISYMHSTSCLRHLM